MAISLTAAISIIFCRDPQQLCRLALKDCGDFGDDFQPRITHALLQLTQGRVGGPAGQAWAWVVRDDHAQAQDSRRDNQP